MYSIHNNIFYRWGTYFMGITLLICLIACHYIRYPDIIKGEINVWGDNPSIELYSHTTGELTLFFQSGDSVQQGDVIAVIGKNTPSVDLLRRMISQVDSMVSTHSFSLIDSYGITEGRLYDLVTAYNEDLSSSLSTDSLVDYNFRILQNQRAQKINTQKKWNLTEELKIANSRLIVIQEKYQRGKSLFDSGTYSKEQFENIEIQFLEANNLIPRLRFQMNQIDETNLKLMSEERELRESIGTKSNQVHNVLRKQLGNIKAAILDVINSQFVIAPNAGVVELAQYWFEKQHVPAHTHLATIVINSSNYTARGFIYAKGAGKVHVGLPVRIELQDYPKMEFGSIRGSVIEFSNFSSDGKYFVKISLPEHGKTTLDRSLKLTDNQPGVANIIVDESSVLERIFRSFLSLFES